MVQFFQVWGKKSEDLESAFEIAWDKHFCGFQSNANINRNLWSAWVYDENVTPPEGFQNHPRLHLLRDSTSGLNIHHCVSTFAELWHISVRRTHVHAVCAKWRQAIMGWNVHCPVMSLCYGCHMPEKCLSNKFKYRPNKLKSKKKKKKTLV